MSNHERKQTMTHSRVTPCAGSDGKIHKHTWMVQPLPMMARRPMMALVMELSCTKAPCNARAGSDSNIQHACPSGVCKPAAASRLGEPDQLQGALPSKSTSTSMWAQDHAWQHAGSQSEL
eukprot:1142610-Pelagomonas_calceolata.AAC.4